MHVNGGVLNGKSFVDIEDVVDIIAVMLEDREVIHKGKSMNRNELKEALLVMNIGVRVVLEKQGNKK